MAPKKTLRLRAFARNRSVDCSLNYDMTLKHNPAAKTQDQKPKIEDPTLTNALGNKSLTKLRIPREKQGSERCRFMTPAKTT
jgi:hypothetical protein